MKYFAVLCFAALVVCAVHADDDKKAKAKAISEKCLTESGADKEILQKVRQGDYVDNKGIEKYFACTMKSIGVIADNHWKIEVLENMLPANIDKEASKKVLKKCSEEITANGEEGPYKFYQCFRTGLGSEVKFF